MRTISKKEIGSKLISLLDEEHPIDEDIGVLDDFGEVLGVVITKDAYQFFLKKVEEEEDRIDSQTIDEFHKSREKDNE